MFEIRVTICCPDLVAAVQALTKGTGSPVTAGAPAAPTMAPAPVPPRPAPVAAPTAPVAPAPVAAPAAVPLASAPGFTLEQVGKAGANLITINPGKMPELMALLAKFGVQTVQQLQPDQLGAFATALRGMGADI